MFQSKNISTITFEKKIFMKVKSSIIGVIAFLFLALGSCSNSETAGLKTISPEEFSKLLAENSNAQLIDVRTPEEFTGGSIGNALNIDFNSVDFVEQLEQLDKTKPVYLYCLSGGRSAQAAQTLLNEGFKEVIELDGGIMAWNAASLPLGNIEQTTAGLTKSAFENLLKFEGKVIVDFSAEWCGPCKKLAPIITEIESEYAGKVKVLRIDVDENSELAGELGISSIPLLHIYQNQKLVWENVGLVDKSVIVDQLK